MIVAFQCLKAVEEAWPMVYFNYFVLHFSFLRLDIHRYIPPPIVSYNVQNTTGADSVSWINKLKMNILLAVMWEDSASEER